MRSKRNSSKKPLFVGLAVLALIIVTITALELTNTTHLFHSEPVQKTAEPNTSQSNIDYSAAKPADNATNNARKESDAKDQTQTLTQSQAPSTATAVTATNVNTSTDPIHIGTLVSGTTSGTCTATFTDTSSSAKTVQASSAVALQGNSYTCGALNIAKSKIAAGTYNISVTLGSAQSNTLSGVAIP